MVKQK
jgi:hypothetical protein